MPQLSIQLKSWKQILAAVIVLAGAVMGYSRVVQKRLEPRLKPLIEQRLKVDLQREAFERTIPTGQDVSPTHAQGEKYLQEHNKVEQLRIVSIEKRGWGSRIIAKVLFTLGDSTQKEQSRYYRLKHGWLTGWYMHGLTTEFAWKTAWL